MSKQLKWLFPLGLLSLSLLLTDLRGEPVTLPAGKTTPRLPATVPVSTASPAVEPIAANTNSVLRPNTMTICPVDVIAVFDCYTVYLAHICDPAYVDVTTWNNIPGLTLGSCGLSPDCAAYNGGAAAKAAGQPTSHVTATGLGRSGLPTLGQADGHPRLTTGAELVDSQFVDLALDSPVPTAAHRVRLELIKHTSRDKKTRFIAVGYEVARDDRSAELLVAPRDVEVVDEHCCIIRLGSVRYQVVTNSQTPSLK